MKRDTIFKLILLAFISFVIFFSVLISFDEKTNEISNFEECLKAGYPIMESYPRKCQVPEGDIFSEYIGNELEKLDLIFINNPRPNQKVSNPIEISGQARGYWYFEADFPVELFDENGNVIGTAIAFAQNDWMTEEFVEFKAVLEFIKPETEKGVLVLKKDNPSGLSKNDDKLIVPVNFD